VSVVFKCMFGGCKHPDYFKYINAMAMMCVCVERVYLFYAER